MLSACATLSEGECRTADWNQIGRRDGANGEPRARLFKHREACAEYGVRPNRERYFAGRRLGLKQYCTPRNGFLVGREGDPYRDVCPAETESAFLAEYRQGEEIHEVEEAIERVGRDIDNARRRLERDDVSDDRAHEISRGLRDDTRRLRRLIRERARLDRLHALRERG